MTAIDVGGLLDKLAEQRRDRAGISTTSLNLVCFVDDHDLRERMSARIDELAERYVSRAILLSCEDGGHAVRSHSIEVNDTVVTHSEQIHLAVRDVAADELRSIVQGLLVPTVRTVLLWAGEHLTDARFEALGSLADTIVLFSSARDSGSGSLREVLALRGTAMERKVRDLAFLRLAPWQDTIAQFFDDPELVDELPHLRRVEATTGSAPEAYYLIGWLAGRLKWEACGRNEFCNADGRTITVEIERGPVPRRIYSVQLYSAGCVFSATMEHDADDLICLTVQGEKPRQHRCVPLHDIDMVSLVERAIFMPRGEIFSETLGMVERLLQHEP
ncbi:MAG TPA: glucose-6-phosphate dehydrogenase assembly protein OpcA [Candidatus Baltobacteraceae bacterium]|nr:glucose-6-phosphate dehydrogenase assembly protein OpcA [Candidatus Baltobacteraceae bacterium]